MSPPGRRPRLRRLWTRRHAVHVRRIEPGTVVLRDAADVDGTMWRAVTLTEDGGLALRGHDLGPGVQRIFGMGEYEFERRLSAAETRDLCTLLGVPPGGDVLTSIAERFPGSGGLEDFMLQHGIEGRFWNRIGD